jgi:hypothetical protein
MEGAMRHAHYTLTGKDVQEHAAGLIQHHLRLVDFSAQCTAAVLLHVLFAAAARLTSVFAATLRLKESPCAETIRQAVLATLPSYAELQKRVNRALVGDLPKALRRRRQRLAIDLHLRPYYGEPCRDPKEIYRSQAKAGTNDFHAYATAYLVDHGQRFTVALTPVEQGEKMNVVIKRLLALARKAGIRPRLLLLDRGFYSIEVIRYLQSARVPFLMPAVARGRQAKAGQPATGIRAFQLRTRGGWGTHRLTAGKKTARVLIGVHCGNYRGQWKRQGRYAWVYAYWGFEPATTRWLADTYRQRFGIETSYRQLNEARIKTCTRDPKVRFLYMALALILRNVWVWLHWAVLSSPRRGRRLLRLDRLRFKAMLLCLLHVAEAALEIADDCFTQRQSRPKLRTA